MQEIRKTGCTELLSISAILFFSVFMLSCGSRNAEKTIPAQEIRLPWNSELQKEIQKIDSNWSVKIDTAKQFVHNYIQSGKYMGELILTKDRQQIIYYIYSPQNGILEKEINHYLMLASCALSEDNFKFTTIEVKGLVLFLPNYPCQSSYPDNSKELIGKLIAVLSRQAGVAGD
jgi:hypothetical protein